MKTYNIIIFFSLLIVNILTAQGHNYEWIKTISGTNSVQSFSITTDTSGNIYTTGYFNGTVDFDTDNDTDYHYSGVGENVFIHKMSQSSTTIAKNDFDNQLTVYPNPNKGNFYIDLVNNYYSVKILITDITGKEIYTNTLTQTQKLPISIEKIPAGIYFLCIQSEEKTTVIKKI